MNAHDLITSWPSLRAMTPDDILASPAWLCGLTFEDAPASLARVSPASDELLVSLSFDGEPHILGFADAAFAPDLHLLWAKRAELPENLLLALVEKECGGVLQMLENLSRAEVKLVGLADRVTSAPRMSFQLSRGSQPALVFSLDLPQSLVEEFGRLENFDPMHLSIRTLTRPIRAHFAELALTPDEADHLQTGDFLMLEEAAPRWITDDPQDDSLHLVASSTEPATFAQFADGKLPEPPALGSAPLVLIRRGKPVFKATLAKVGSALAVQLS